MDERRCLLQSCISHWHIIVTGIHYCWITVEARVKLAFTLGEIDSCTLIQWVQRLDNVVPSATAAKVVAIAPIPVAQVMRQIMSERKQCTSATERLETRTCLCDEAPGRLVPVLGRRGEGGLDCGLRGGLNSGELTPEPSMSVS